MFYFVLGSILGLWLLGLLPTKVRRMMARSQRNARARAVLANSSATRGTRFLWLARAEADVVAPESLVAKENAASPQRDRVAV
jgi:hypothetical protein